MKVMTTSFRGSQHKSLIGIVGKSTEEDMRTKKNFEVTDDNGNTRKIRAYRMIIVDGNLCFEGSNMQEHIAFYAPGTWLNAVEIDEEDGQEDNG